MERMFGAFGVVCFVALVLVVGTVIYISLMLFPLATNIIDIGLKLEPVEPYDIAKLEQVTDMNNTHWTVVVKYIDVDTNTTVYEELVYNLNTKTFSHR